MNTEVNKQEEPQSTPASTTVKQDVAIPGSNFIDFGTFQALGFDLYFDEGVYNLHLVFMVLGEEKEFVDGMFLRTTIFEKTIEEVANHIDTLFNMGLFDNLIFVDSGHIIDPDSNIIGEVDWTAHNIVRSNLYNSEGAIH